MRSLQRQEEKQGREWGCFWMVGQVDRWHWVALPVCRVWLQHVCHTHTLAHTPTQTWPHGAATWTVCLSADFAVVFVFIHFFFASANWSCFIILRLFLIFCALSLCFFYLCSPWFIQYLSTCVSAELMWRIMEPHSFSHARIMQSNARRSVEWGPQAGLGCLAAGDRPAAHQSQ